MLTCRLVAAIVLSTATCLGADEAGEIPANARAYFDAEQKILATQFQKLEQEFQRARKAGDRKSLAATAKAIAEFKKKPPEVAPEIETPLEVGNIGRLPSHSFVVLQILADGETYGTLRHFYTVTSVVGGAFIQIPKTSETTLIVKGVPNANWTDGSKQELSGVFHVTGPVDNLSVLGKNIRSLVLEPFDATGLDQYRKAYEQEKRAAAKSKNRPRTRPTFGTDPTSS